MLCRYIYIYVYWIFSSFILVVLSLQIFIQFIVGRISAEMPVILILC